MGKKKQPTPNQTDIYNRATTAYNETRQPSALENEMAPISQNFMNNYNQAVQRDTQDYGDIMGGYKNFLSGFKPSFERVKYERPAELGESFGYLRETMPGYREFAKTGGYSAQDIQELRARGIAPIRSAYGNTMMELDRARSLGGAGGAPNYIAAASRAQREMPGQMADAMTTVNAGLADAIRQGRLAGLSGMTQVGGTMGGLSSEEAGRIMQANLANQGADLQTQQMGMQGRLGALSGMQSLYGTTPGMSSMFGNQALNAYGQRGQLEGNRQNYGLGLLDAQMRSQGMANQQKGTPWWKTALSVAGTVAPYVAMAASSKKLKHDIKDVDKGTTSRMAKYFKELPLKTWKYKGEDTTHFGPMAEDFQKVFGLGDGKTLHLADVMGVMLATAKEASGANA
jgi:endosialidase-like protein